MRDFIGNACLWACFLPKGNLRLLCIVLKTLFYKMDLNTGKVDEILGKVLYFWMNLL